MNPNLTIEALNAGRERARKAALQEADVQGRARAESGPSRSGPPGGESCFERLNAEFVAVDVAGHRLNEPSAAREEWERRQALNAGMQAAA